jgi:thiol:disulfide interchange protein
MKLCLIFLTTLVLTGLSVCAQDGGKARNSGATHGATAQEDGAVKLYDPSANAMLELRSAVAQAVATGKHVLVQVGGNWCSWCHKLDRLFQSDRRIDSLLQADYVSLRVNHSKENTNEEVLRRLDGPQRFGFPVLLVLDSSGRLLHTQDTGQLEKDGAHDPERVYRFLYLWRPDAVSEFME